MSKVEPGPRRRFVGGCLEVVKKTEVVVTEYGSHNSVDAIRDGELLRHRVITSGTIFSLEGKTKRAKRRADKFAKRKNKDHFTIREFLSLVRST